jgi:hypothetical protein
VFLGNGAYRDAARHALLRMRLAAHALVARAQFKGALVSSQRRWSMPNAVERSLGRDCAACDLIGKHDLLRQLGGSAP